MNKKNLGFYVAETVIIVGVLATLLTLSLSIWIQSLLLFGMLIAYILLGISRPRVYHNSKGKVLLEYIAVSVVIFAAFLFVNANKF